jgi:hypothetical protein
MEGSRQMTQTPTYAGIDVAKDRLDVVLRLSGGDQGYTGKSTLAGGRIITTGQQHRACHRQSTEGGVH